MSLLKSRERLAKQLIDYYTGLTDIHPMGVLSKKAEFLPASLSCNMWDVTPRCWEYSEFNYYG